MRILVVNSNTSDVVTGKVAAAARAAASPGTEIVAVTGTFGARVIGTRSEHAIAEHSTIALVAKHAHRLRRGGDRRVLRHRPARRARAAGHSGRRDDRGGAAHRLHARRADRRDRVRPAGPADVPGARRRVRPRRTHRRLAGDRKHRRVPARRPSGARSRAHRDRERSRAARLRGDRAAHRRGDGWRAGAAAGRGAGARSSTASCAACARRSCSRASASRSRAPEATQRRPVASSWTSTRRSRARFGARAGT